MRRPFKKAVAFVVFLAMVLQLVSFTNAEAAAKASKSSDFSFDAEYGSISEYTGTDKDVVIPESMGATSVYLYDGAFESITIPEGVLYVTLSGIAKLKKITLPSTVTYLYLYGLDSLKELDLSNLNDQSDNSVSIYNLNALEKIEAGTYNGSFTIDGCGKIKNVDLSEGSLSYVSFYNCPLLETITISTLSENATFDDLPALKSATIPNDVSYLWIEDTSFDAFKLAKQDENGYFIDNGGLYRYETSWDGVTELCLKQVDVTKEKIDVIEGTHRVDYLGLSASAYRLKTINLPDSLENIADYAFQGGSGLKQLNIPKNVLSIGYYAFADTSIEKIVLPKSVRSISDDAFGGFEGKVDIEGKTDYLEKYSDGIYYHALDSEGNVIFTSLIYYPSNKTDIKFLKGTNYIGASVFVNSKIKNLKLPDGVMYLDLYLNKAVDLASLSIPASVWWISEATITSAPNLKKLSVAKDNEYYESYDNCLYDKGKTTFLAAPLGITKIVIPEGVLSLSAYSLNGYYKYAPGSNKTEYEWEDPDYTAVHRSIYLPSTIENYPEYWDSMELNKLYLYADSDFVEYLRLMNSENRYWAEEYGYEPSLYEYEFRDSNKDLLNMIYVVDAMTVKKGSEELLELRLPGGLDWNTKLARKDNTEVQIKLSSSDKKVAKVDANTGIVKGVKKGTCTINVKCTITNGKKKNTKSFKIKMKVK